MTISPYDLAKEASQVLSTFVEPPDAAVVLGSGLGSFAEQLEESITIPYSELPGFPDVGVVGHAGKLVVGRIGDGGPRVAAMSGRVHLYEGHSIARVVHPARSMALWGVRSIVFTNAAGCINPDFSPGELMLITDHLNLTGTNPLLGENDDRFGTRFPDMSTAYDLEVSAALRAAATSNQVHLREGTYAGLLGPSYETPAEIRMLRAMGADAVGMSTVCEVIAARHCGLLVGGVSCITNYAAGLSPNELSHDEVKETASLARDAFINVLNDGLKRVASQSF